MQFGLARISKFMQIRDRKLNVGFERPLNFKVCTSHLQETTK